MDLFGIVSTKNLGKIFSKAVKNPRYALHSFYRRFLSFLTFSYGNGYSAPPETISFFLTYTCNLRCSMCGQWGENGVYKDYGKDQLKQSLDRETIIKVLDEVKGASPTITMFGGEPMMFKGWLDLLKEAKLRGLRVNIVTNAVFLAKHAEKVVELGLDEIIFSLDGPQEIHDQVRGKEGTFENAMKGFKAVNEAKKRLNKTLPHLTINATVTPQNYHCLEKIVDVAEEINAYHLTIHHLLFLNKKSCDSNNEFFKQEFGRPSPDWYGFVWDELPDIDVEVMLRKMEEIRKRKSSVNIIFYPNYTEEEIRRYYTTWEFEAESYSNRCVSPWMVAYIFPDGSVKPYHSMDFVAGNINDDSFYNVWNNEDYKKYRRVLKEKGKFSVCSKGCTELYRY